jgi:EmrB/QacA subfamily drug resistance transporter
VFGRDVPYKYVVAVIYVAALFIDILDVSIVNVALPALGRDLHTDAVEWVVLGYTLSLAVWIPASGWLGDRLGTRRIFLTALGLFVGASALCGAAQSVNQLIAFRVVQGVGGGMLTPVGIAMLYRAFPPVERAKAATVLMIPAVTAPALGPLVGGLLVTNVGWRWIFYINLPIGIAAFAFAFRYLREHTEPSARSFDLGGFVLSGSGLALVVYSLSEGPRSGWTSWPVLGSAVAGVVLLAAMVRHELAIPAPMLDLRLLKERMFRTANIISVFSQASFVGVIFLMPLYLQTLRGYTALQSGLTTFPQAVGVVLASQVSGRIYHWVGPRRLISGGMFAATFIICGFILLGLDTNLWWVRLLLFLRGIAMGFSFVPLQASSYARIAPSDNGRASSIFATQRQMAISVGVALLATVLSSFTPLVGPVSDPDRALEGFHAAFGVAAGLAFLAALAALTIHDSDAANTMRGRQARGREVAKLESAEPAQP